MISPPYLASAGKEEPLFDLPPPLIIIILIIIYNYFT